MKAKQIQLVTDRIAAAKVLTLFCDVRDADPTELEFNDPPLTQYLGIRVGSWFCGISLDDRSFHAIPERCTHILLQEGRDLMIEGLTTHPGW